MNDLMFLTHQEGLGSKPLCSAHPIATILSKEDAGSYSQCAGCAIRQMVATLSARFSFPSEHPMQRAKMR
jgi:hypothetical protein